MPFEALYSELIDESSHLSGEELTSYWLENLPYMSRDEYVFASNRPTEIVRFAHGNFEYLIDHFSAIERSTAELLSAADEDRLVLVWGRSNPTIRRRDDYRLVGWVGKTMETFGSLWDKGHFIAHSIGGAVDGIEANVFVQRRDLNRGWSVEGKRYRKMETYCVAHPNTFCFARPIYDDGTSRPAFLDFGLLTVEGQLWVERFDNRLGS